MRSPARSSFRYAGIRRPLHGGHLPGDDAGALRVRDPLRRKSVPMTVLDQDGTQESRQYIERFAQSPYFAIQRYVDNYRDLQSDIDRGRSRVGLVISAGLRPKAWLAPRSGRPGDRRRRRQQHRNDRDELRVPDTRAYSSSVMIQQMEAVLRQANLTIRRSKPSRASGSIRIWKACSSWCLESLPSS